MDTKWMRWAVFALLGAAIAVNAGYGMWKDGIDTPFGRIDDEGRTIPDSVASITIPELTSGDMVTSTYNLTVSMEWKDKDGGPETGVYQVSGISRRSIDPVSYRQHLTGQYSLTLSNSSGTFMMTGSMDRDRGIDFTKGPGLASESIRTSITLSGGKFGETSSEVEVTIPRMKGANEEFLWTPLLEGGRTMTSTSSGTVFSPLALNEIGYLTENATMNWKVTDLARSEEGKQVTVHTRASPVEGLSLSYTVRFSDTEPWPLDFDVRLDREYISMDGTVSVSMRSREVLLGIVRGLGGVTPFRCIESDGGEEAVGEQLQGPVPLEGGETSYIFTPAEALSFAEGNSEGVSSFISRHGRDRVTFERCSYFRNDSRLGGERWVWNITLSAQDVDGGIDLYDIRVGSIKLGDMLGRTKLEVLYEGARPGNEHIEPRRGLITLFKNEQALMASSYSEEFFATDGYRSSYRLDITAGSLSAAGPRIALMWDMIGAMNAGKGDLFISRAMDALDPTVAYIEMVNGLTGETLSRTRAEGAAVTLINAYDADQL